MGNKKEGKIVWRYFPPLPTNFDPIEYGGKWRGKAQLLVFLNKKKKKKKKTVIGSISYFTSRSHSVH